MARRRNAARSIFHTAVGPERRVVDSPDIEPRIAMVPDEAWNWIEPAHVRKAAVQVPVDGRDRELAERETIILKAMAKATLTEQRELLAELNGIRAEKTARLAASRELDLANATVADHLTPIVSMGSRSTAKSDWLDDVPALTPGDMSHDMIVEAAMFWRNTHAAVKADVPELVEQAKGRARVVASRFEGQAPAARRIFMEEIVRLAAAHPAQEPAEDGVATSTLPVAINPSDAPETFDTNTLSDADREAIRDSQMADSDFAQKYQSVLRRKAGPAGVNIVDIRDKGDATEFVDDQGNTYLLTLTSRANEGYDPETGEPDWWPEMDEQRPPHYYTLTNTATGEVITGIRGTGGYDYGPIEDAITIAGDILAGRAKPGWYDWQREGARQYQTSVLAAINETMWAKLGGFETEDDDDYDAKENEAQSKNDDTKDTGGDTEDEDEDDDDSPFPKKDASLRTAAAHDFCPRCGSSGATMQPSGTMKCDNCGHEHLNSQRTDKKKDASLRTVGNGYAVGTPAWFAEEQRVVPDPDPEKTRLFPNGIPLHGDLSPEQQAWMDKGRKKSVHRTAAETCPGCGGPIEFFPGDKDGITVYFECKNPNCKSGKLTDADRAKIKSFSSKTAAEQVTKVPGTARRSDWGDGDGACSKCFVGIWHTRAEHDESVKQGQAVGLGGPINAPQGTYSSRRTAAEGRSLSEIAREIRGDWKNVYFGAVPYLEAMESLDSIHDTFGADDAASIVGYFLSNATTWRGETAKRVKAELKGMWKQVYGSKTAGAPTIMGPDQDLKNAPKAEQDAYWNWVGQMAADSDSGYYVPLSFRSWRSSYWSDEKGAPTYAPGMPPMASSRRKAVKVDDLRRIVENRQYENIDGMLVDGFTASAITQVFDALGPEAQQKYAQIIESDLGKASDIAFKLINKNSSRRTAADEPAQDGAAESTLPVAINPSDAPEGLDQLNENPQPATGMVGEGSGPAPQGAAAGGPTTFNDFVKDHTKASAFRARVQSNLRRTAVSLTNVGLDGENGIGTDPSGNRIRFRLSPQDRKDLSSVLFSDLAINFSGVDVDESDIIREAGRKTAMPNPVDLGVKVGDIFVSTWGYDQTNVDFYEVVGLTGASVKVRPIASQTHGTPTLWAQRDVMPVPGQYTGEVMTKRIQNYSDVPSFTLSSYSDAYLWDGKPVHETSYA